MSRLPLFDEAYGSLSHDDTYLSPLEEDPPFLLELREDDVPVLTQNKPSTLKEMSQHKILEINPKNCKIKILHKTLLYSRKKSILDKETKLQNHVKHANLLKDFVDSWTRDDIISKEYNNNDELTYEELRFIYETNVNLRPNYTKSLLYNRNKG